jgi:hypothetical protein
MLKPRLERNEVAELDTRKVSYRLWEVIEAMIVYHPNGMYCLDIEWDKRFNPLNDYVAEIIHLWWIRSRRRKVYLPPPRRPLHSRRRAKRKTSKPYNARR